MVVVAAKGEQEEAWPNRPRRMTLKCLLRRMTHASIVKIDFLVTIVPVCGQTNCILVVKANMRDYIKSHYQLMSEVPIFV